MNISSLESVPNRIAKPVRWFKLAIYVVTGTSIEISCLSQGAGYDDSGLKFISGERLLMKTVSKVLVVRERGCTRVAGLTVEEFRFNEDIQTVTDKQMGKEWNSIGRHVVSAIAVDTYKDGLDRFLEDEKGW